MKLKWEISDEDVSKVKDLVEHNQNAFVSSRIKFNVEKQGINISKDNVLKAMIMCLFTTQQKIRSHFTCSCFFEQKPFPITIQELSRQPNIESFIRSTLVANGLNRYINKIPDFFFKNYLILEKLNWSLLDLLQKLVNSKSKHLERNTADEIAKLFIGFGP